jgi:hypothetical protein
LLGAVIAGALDSHFGSRRFPVRVISLLLATVLVVARCKTDLHALINYGASDKRGAVSGVHGFTR